MSWGADVFERLYADRPDPWGFTTSAYEQEKYRLTLAALGARRFTDAFEVGCSIGVLTRRLAVRCDRLLAVDLAEAALAAARSRTADRPGVRIERRTIPADWPDGTFDLIVLSEVLYFLGTEDRTATALQARKTLRPGGWLLLVNWTGPTDTPATGHVAAAQVEQVSGLRPLRRIRAPSWRLDLLASPSART